VLFSLKCTRNRLAAPLGEFERFPRSPSRIRGLGPQEGRGREGMGTEGMGREGEEWRGRERKGGREKKLIDADLKGRTSKGGAVA